MYRILALAVYAFTPTAALNLTWLLGFLLLVSLLHCTCQPYKKKWHNFIEGSIFTILASLTIITFYRLFQAETTNTPTNTSFWIQTVLLYCPLVYFIVYASIKVFLWLQPRVTFVKITLLKFCGINPLVTGDSSNSQEFPARMEDDGDNYSTTSESTSESIVGDDDELQDNEQEQHQREQDDGDVEMLLPVEWNDADDDHSNMTSPYAKSWVTL